MCKTREYPEMKSKKNSMLLYTLSMRRSTEVGEDDDKFDVNLMRKISRICHVSIAVNDKLKQLKIISFAFSSRFQFSRTISGKNTNEAMKIFCQLFVARSLSQ